MECVSTCFCRVCEKDSGTVEAEESVEVDCECRPYVEAEAEAAWEVNEELDVNARGVSTQGVSG